MFFVYEMNVSAVIVIDIYIYTIELNNKIVIDRFCSAFFLANSKLFVLLLLLFANSQAQTMMMMMMMES